MKSGGIRIGTLIIPDFAVTGLTPTNLNYWSTLQTAGFDLAVCDYYSSEYASGHSSANWPTYLGHQNTLGLQGIYSVGEEWRASDYAFANGSAFFPLYQDNPSLWAAYHFDEPVWNCQPCGFQGGLPAYWQLTGGSIDNDNRGWIDSVTALHAIAPRVRVYSPQAYHTSIITASYNSTCATVNAHMGYTGADGYGFSQSDVTSWMNTYGAGKPYFLVAQAFGTVSQSDALTWMQQAEAGGASGVLWWGRRTTPSNLVVNQTSWNNILAAIASFRSTYTSTGTVCGTCANIFQLT